MTRTHDTSGPNEAPRRRRSRPPLRRLRALTARHSWGTPHRNRALIFAENGGGKQALPQFGAIWRLARSRRSFTALAVEARSSKRTRRQVCQ